MEEEHSNVAAFQEKLQSSKRIFILCGAELSASSGLPIFRGANNTWRNHKASQLGTARAFRTDPGLVWLFYTYLRHLALLASPNSAHRALSALSKAKPDVLCISQCIDNLTQRASFPADRVHQLRGSLFDIKCSSETCFWSERDNFDDPFCEPLAQASVHAPPNEPLPLLDPYHRINHVSEEELPKCPQCGAGLKRPGVAWIGDPEDQQMIEDINSWLFKGKVDLMLVVGASAQDWPASGYISKARMHGARVAIINREAFDDAERHAILPGDFAFAKDATEILPTLLEPLIKGQSADAES